MHGDDTALMIDFNQGLNLADALQRCHAIDDLCLTWMEEPIVYDNFDGFAQLAAELKTPIQIGENFYGPRDVHTALQKKACDFVMPDFMRIGEVTGWLRAAAIAGAAGICAASTPVRQIMTFRGKSGNGRRREQSHLKQATAIPTGQSLAPCVIEFHAHVHLRMIVFKSTG